jgi:hypothetical protein
LSAHSGSRRKQSSFPSASWPGLFAKDEAQKIIEAIEIRIENPTRLRG